MFPRVGILLSIFVCSSFGESARKAKYFPFPQTRNPSIHDSYPVQSHHGGYHGDEHPIKCPFPYVKVGDLCLYLYCDTTGTDVFSWDAARAYCQNEVGNGDLVVFEDACEFADALKFVTNEDPTAACDYFIGGSSTTTDVAWTWVDGTYMPLGAPYWAPDSATPGQLLPGSAMGEAFLDSGNFYLIANDATGGATYSPLCQYKPETSYGSGSYGSYSNSASFRSPYPAFHFPSVRSGYFPNPYQAHAQPSYSRSRSALNPPTKSFRGSQRQKNIGEKLKERSPVQHEYNFGQQQAENFESRQQQEIEPEYRHDEPQTPLVKSQDSLDKNVPPTLESINPFLKTKDKKTETQDESPAVAEESSPRNPGLQQDPKEEGQELQETILYEKLFPSIIQEMAQTLDDIKKRS